MSASKHVIDVDLQNFEQTVLVGSSETPVLVDFWAEWCEPCKALGPVLEQVTEEYAGGLVLAKVDIDANPDIAQAFRIQSVPTVVLIVDGRPVDAFSGALPYKEIKDFLAKHVAPSAAGDPLAEARTLLENGELVPAIGVLHDLVEAEPGHAEARAALSRCLLEAEDVEGAREHYAALDEAGRELDDAKSVQAKLELLESAGDVDELLAALEAAPKDVAKRVAYGKALVAAGRTEEGLEELLEACMRGMYQDDDAPRQAMLDVFQALGTQDPLTLEFQQRLSVLLCS